MTTQPDRLRSFKREQRGVALLIALVMVAIATTLAAAMAWDSSLDIHRTANLIQGDQAMQYALGAEDWAEQILRRDLIAQQRANQLTGGGNTGSTSVNLTQDWAMHLPPLPVQGGSVTGQLQDLQGLFNLNSLVHTTVSPATQSPAYQQFQRLLTALDLDPGIANAVVDWVNPGDQPSVPAGAKDETYSRLQPPYYTAERPMTSISELLLVNGVTPEIYRKLAPYVCALPLVNTQQFQQNPQQQLSGIIGLTTGSTPSQINVNTAPPVVLMSLSPSMDLGTATAIAQALAIHPIDNQTQEAAIWSQLTGNRKFPDNAGITSEYFRLTVNVQIGSSQLTMYSLLFRNGTNGGTFAIRRTFGTL